MSARLAYMALFSVALPALLVAWTIRLDAVLTLPAYGSIAPGAAVAIAGLALMTAATRDLWVHGRGLPASPFPPERLVTRGVYSIIAHPIYLGAVLVAAGMSLATRSAPGLWIVSPVLALSAAAFVIGFEQDATHCRYGTLPTPLLRLPSETDERPSAFDRAAIYALVFLPWLVLFEGVAYLGVPRDARSTYLATYPFVVLAPLAASRRSDLRRFALGGTWATAIIIPLYVLLPGSQPVNALPAFHVVWACLAGRLYASRWPRMRWFWWAFVAAAAAASCVTTGMHAAADVVAGVGAYALVERREVVWRRVCDGAERLANSGREIVLGPVRLMSHGIYAGVGATVGLIVAVALTGSQNIGWLVAMMLAAVFGAALWAQLVEGSPQLLRPYGYFGAVVIVIVLALAASLVGADAWLLFVSFGIGGCFAHAIGRVRCLVQGCCHGREAPAFLGIRYVHPLSRVVRLSALGGVPVHPTPLYSMMWMMLVGLVLLRLWALAAPLQFIAGTYFVLVGLGRFVEEHFRGEPQTLVIAGLRLYQWLAIAFVIGGAVLTTLGSTAAPTAPPFDPRILPIAVIVGAFYYVAYGVDIPGSSCRFSRLR